MKLFTATLSLLLACLAAGCEEADKVCDPGQRASCTCAGAASGEKTCLFDGSGWEACQCCYARCFGRVCGEDGCGGSCGTCAASEFCNFRGRCECVPDCAGKDCGGDGCGGSCGTCAASEFCNFRGRCECVPDCADQNCGGDGCGGSCGECGGPGLCNPSGRCDACTHHEDPVCTADGEVCAVAVEEGALVNRCAPPTAGGREPGYYCDEGAGLVCESALCVDHACGALCAGNLQCAGFEGTTCQNVDYTLEGVTGAILSCAPVNPGETLCGHTLDCDPSRVCSYSATRDEVLAVCLPPNPGGAAAGAPCDVNADCATNLCVCLDHLCDGSDTGACSVMCATTTDCPEGKVCGGVAIPDLAGADHTVFACVRDPNACRYNADCPAGRSCGVFLGVDGCSLVTECQYGKWPTGENTGAPCATATDCFSVWCGEDGYCLGLCVEDAGCPTFEEGKTCGGDSDCEPGYLCQAGACERRFRCGTEVFTFADCPEGQTAYDTVLLCEPEKRPCALDADCRTGEACRQELDQAATGVVLECGAGGPGSGTLGADCSVGASVCWTGVCLDDAEGGGSYCSKACVTDADCEPTDTYSCQAIRVDVRPGFVSFVPACARR